MCGKQMEQHHLKLASERDQAFDFFFTGRKRCRGVRISLGGCVLALGSKSEHLGAILDTSLTETAHIGHVIGKAMEMATTLQVWEGKWAKV